MSDDEMRHLFATVLTAPPPDTTDIDAAIRVGRRQQHRRAALLSSAAVIAVGAIAGAAALPSLHRSPAYPAVTGAPITASDGTKVTDPHQLFGSWQTIQLDGKDVRAVRDTGDQPLGVTFYLINTKPGWVANDVTNANDGIYSVSTSGQFRATATFSSAVGPARDREQYRRNPEAVQEATEARLVAATPTGPPELLLLADAKIVAVYTPMTPTVVTTTGHK
jgi:hypothetical protein